MSVSRHLIANVLLLAAATMACIYLYPYSLHRVIHATYAQFDLPPGENGLVHYFPFDKVDYRLPVRQLSSESLREIHQIAAGAQDAPASDSQLAARFVAMIRERLNRLDDSLPSADALDLEQLYRDGMNYYCLCGDHSRLLNEALQAEGLQSRIVWMEGHIVVEYFDSSLEKWVFLDPHLNLRGNSSDGVPLSIAQLTFFVERELPVAWEPICPEFIAGQSAAADHFDNVWYRNILLNGECYVLSGETLASSGRWDQLLHYGSRPQVLSLDTPFDTSDSQFRTSFRIRSVLLLQTVVAASFYLGHLIATAGTSRPGTNRLISPPRSSDLVPRQGTSEGSGGWGRSEAKPPAAGGSLSFDPSHPSVHT
jgi:hypothetical protein